MYAEAIHIATATSDSMQHFKDYECIWYVTEDLLDTTTHHLIFVLRHIFGTVVTHVYIQPCYG